MFWIIFYFLFVAFALFMTYITSNKSMGWKIAIGIIGTIAIFVGLLLLQTV